MRCILYTDMPVKQVLNNLTERMEAKPSKSRPEMDGWIEKGGAFSISITTKILRRFNRTTHLRGIVERENGSTVIRAAVPHGVPRKQIPIIIVAASLLGLVIMLNTDKLLGLFTVALGCALYIPLVGDNENSDVLVKELKRLAKAKDKPLGTGANKSES